MSVRLRLHVKESDRAMNFRDLRVRVRSRLQNRRMQEVVGTVGAQLAIFGLNAIQSIILARLLSPYARGEYGTVVLFTQILLYAGMLGTSFSIARRSQPKEDSLEHLKSASLRAGIFTGLISFVVVLLLSFIALPESKSYLAPLCVGIALALPFEHARLALLAVDHGSGEFRRYNINRLVSAMVLPLLLGIFWWFGMVTVLTVTCLSVVSSIVSLFALTWMHRETNLLKNASPSVFVLLKEGRSYAVSYFASQLLGRLDVLLILWLVDFTNQGHYSVAIAVTSLLQVVPSALCLFSFNLGSSNASFPPKRFALAAVGVLSIQAVSACVLGLLLFAFLPWLVGEKYKPSIPMAIALLPGLVVDGAATVAEGFIRGRGKPLSTMLPRVFGAVTLVICAFLLHPWYAEMSIPIASSIGYSVSGFAIIALAFWSVRVQARSMEVQP